MVDFDASCEFLIKCFKKIQRDEEEMKSAKASDDKKLAHKQHELFEENSKIELRIKELQESLEKEKERVLAEFVEEKAKKTELEKTLADLMELKKQSVEMKEAFKRFLDGRRVIATI
jgi:DNA integrity scanning protein DisA with diadenylate cyclase activity